MAKFTGLLVLVCYFFALMFGLMWYLTYRQLAAERMINMSMMEAEGYLAIHPPTAAQIKRLVQEEQRLQAEIEVMEAKLAAQREEFQSLTQNVTRLKRELADLTLQKNANEEGQKLARMLAAMKPEEAAAALASLDDSVLPSVVEYALPYIADKEFGRLMGAIAKADTTNGTSLAAQILEIIGTALFSLDLDYQRDLDQHQITERLRKAFKENGVLLSQQATVEIQKKGSRWQILDGRQAYRIRREKGQLSIYLRTLS